MGALMARAGFRISVTIVLGLLVVSLSQPAQGQGIGSTLVPRARVFPSIGPGVSALKRDSAGRYYILATPASVISIYDRNGALIGKIPNANSHGATIKYAVDIDLGQDGRIFVADRGANAIEIFNPDGSLAARVPVVAPTSVVALSKNQFAVTSLTSTHLVEIIDERGKVVRSFGDPAYITDEASKNRLVDWGRIAGDSANSIYFAFTTLTEPTLRKYDRFGYVGYEADIPESFFSGGDSGPRDRVEFGLNFTDLSLSERTSSWVSVGTSGDVKFGGGVGMGLNQAFASGGGFGRDAQQAGSQSSFSNTSYNFANDSLGGMFSGEVSSQGTRFHLGVGSLSGLGRGGRRGRGAAGATSSDQLDDQGGILQFFGSGSSFAAGSMQDDWGGDLYVSAQDLNSDAIPGTDISALLNSSSNVTPPALAFNSTLGVPGAFNAWSIFNARDFRPRGGFGWLRRFGSCKWSKRLQWIARPVSGRRWLWPPAIRRLRVGRICPRVLPSLAFRSRRHQYRRDRSREPRKSWWEFHDQARDHCGERRSGDSGDVGWRRRRFDEPQQRRNSDRNLLPHHQWRCSAAAFGAARRAGSFSSRRRPLGNIRI